jgi:hypothetical protein
MSSDLSPVSAGSIQTIVESVLTDLGLSFSHTGEIIVPDELSKGLRLDSLRGRLVMVGDGDNIVDVDLKEHLAQRYKDQPDHFTARTTSKPSTTTTKPADTGNLTERMRKMRAARETPVSRVMQAKAAAIPSNPWKRNNLTEQMFIQKWNPEQAERLKREAGL